MVSSRIVEAESEAVSTLKKLKAARKHFTFEEPKAEAFFIEHAAGKRKLLTFCGSALKKEAGSGSKLGSG